MPSTPADTTSPCRRAGMPQLPVAGRGGGELAVGQVPAEVVDDRSVMGAGRECPRRADVSIRRSSAVVAMMSLSVLPARSRIRAARARSGRVDKTVTGLLAPGSYRGHKRLAGLVAYAAGTGPTNPSNRTTPAARASIYAWVRPGLDGDRAILTVYAGASSEPEDHRESSQTQMIRQRPAPSPVPAPRDLRPGRQAGPHHVQPRPA